MVGKAIRGWVVVSKHDNVMTFGFGTTRRGAQENFTFITDGTTSQSKWKEYADRGHHTVRATLTVDAKKTAPDITN